MPSCSPSTRAPPARARSCSITTAPCTRSRRRSSGRSFRSPAGSSTTPTRSGRRNRASLHEALAKAQRGRARHRRDRHHQPARDDASSGTARPASRSHNAIVWQDRRTAAMCDELERGGHEPLVRGARRASCSTPTSPAPSCAGCSTTSPARAQRAAARRARVRHRRLVARLEAHRRARALHRRDQRVPHAALQHPHRRWDDELLRILDVPRSMLPRGRRRRRRICGTTPIGGVRVPIAGIAGDQQAALFGQACSRPGWRRTPTAPAASC